MSAIKDYDVADGILGIAKPASFILDKDGIIRWKYVGSDKTDRIFSNTIIEKLKSLNGKSENPWDVNSDGKVDIFDLVLVAKNFGEAFFQTNNPNNPNNPNPDVNRDGNVDILDLVLVANHFGENFN